MDAVKVRRLAYSALSSFQTLDTETAVEVALWDLVEILEHVADDPSAVALVTWVKGRIRGEGAALGLSRS
jgi:hypothetical protein